MISDYVNSIKVYLHERASSPLMGAFLVAWLTWNYRLVLLLFSSMPIEEKFEYIDSQLYLDGWDVVLTGIVYPLVASVFFLIAYPVPALWIFGYVRNQQKKQKEVQQAIDDETPLTREESRLIQQKLYSLRKAHEKELSELESVYTQRVSSIDKEVESESIIDGGTFDEIDSMAELPKNQVLVLKEIYHSDPCVEINFYDNAIPFEKLRLQTIVDSLIVLGLVVRKLKNIVIGGRKKLLGCVSLTAKGRQALSNNGDV